MIFFYKYSDIVILETSQVPSLPQPNSWESVELKKKVNTWMNFMISHSKILFECSNREMNISTWPSKHLKHNWLFRSW